MQDLTPGLREPPAIRHFFRPNRAPRDRCYPLQTLPRPWHKGLEASSTSASDAAEQQSSNSRLTGLPPAGTLRAGRPVPGTVPCSRRSPLAVGRPLVKKPFFVDESGGRKPRARTRFIGIGLVLLRAGRRHDPGGSCYPFLRAERPSSDDTPPAGRPRTGGTRPRSPSPRRRRKPGA
jgi:hypothetical protein